MADDWRTANVEALLKAIVRLDDTDEAAAFFRDLCTLGELHDMGQRWAVVRMLDQGLHYADISRQTGASTAMATKATMTTTDRMVEGRPRMIRRSSAKRGVSGART